MNDPEPDRSPAYWIELARGDLAAAAGIVRDASVPPRVAASLAQQSAEKALKAAISSVGAEPPRSHDLVRLAQLAADAVRLTVTTNELRLLADAHIQGRYPDPVEPMCNLQEARDLLEIAAAIVAASTEALLGPRSDQT